LGNIRQKITDEQNKLHESNRQGTPLWMSYVFDPCPFYNSLEKQRNNRFLAYQNTLADMKKLREESIRALQDTSGSNVDLLLKLYTLLRDLSDKSGRLTRKLDALQDDQQDMDAWRLVARYAADVSSKASAISQTYNYKEFLEIAEQLWRTIQNEFESDPLIFGKHKNVRERIEVLEKRISDWVENRRRDFEQKCQSYQFILGQAEIQIAIKVPFDPEHPDASLDALIAQVQSGLQQYLDVSMASITQASTTVMYLIKVQKIPLQGLEDQIHLIQNIMDQLMQIFIPENLRDVEIFQQQIVQRFMSLRNELRLLNSEIQKSMRRQPAEGSEVKLLQMLGDNSQETKTDLYGLITRLLEDGNSEFDLDALMKDIASLFKKGQISVYIGSQGKVDDNED